MLDYRAIVLSAGPLVRRAQIRNSGGIKLSRIAGYGEVIPASELGDFADRHPLLRLAVAPWIEVFEKETLFVSASDLSDESLLRYYDNIRKQVEADRGNKHKFMTSDTIKAYAESLRLELYERQLSHAPIDWWADQQTDTVAPLTASIPVQLLRLQRLKPPKKRRPNPPRRPKSTRLSQLNNLTI